MIAESYAGGKSAEVIAPQFKETDLETITAIVKAVIMNPGHLGKKILNLRKRQL